MLTSSDELAVLIWVSEGNPNVQELPVEYQEDDDFRDLAPDETT